ncbi:hypothetical protein ACQ4PT_048628 [Festuca glaucescens]
MEKMSSSDAQPINLHMLKTITQDFSDNMKIGSGGYGTVYKGVLHGDEIAVKRLFAVPGLDDEAFDNEFRNLKKVQHKNVIRMMGYCYETTHRDVEYDGKYVWSQVIDRALCFEYMKEGSLANHISDESCKYDWPTTYKIIKGACEGLHYLHKGRGDNNYIYHLDLKPDNILLDENLVPKIGDFGLSKLFGESKTHQTSTTKGTIGFMPPEYINHAKVTPKNDVFSLGVIIFYMLVGKQGYGNYCDALLPLNFSTKIRQELIESVQEYWKKKMEATVGYRWDETDVLGVTKCIEIAMSSVNNNRDSRPSTTKIIDELKKLDAQIDEMLQKDPKPPVGMVPVEELPDMEINVNDLEVIENNVNNMEAVENNISQNDSGKDIAVDLSMELRFPFEPKRDISCCLQLINKADSFIAFNIKVNRKKYRVQPNKGILPPCSKCYITVTLQAQEEAPPGMKCLDMAIIQATRVHAGFTCDEISEDFLKKASSVDEVALPIVYVALEEPLSE